MEHLHIGFLFFFPNINKTNNLVFVKIATKTLNLLKTVAKAIMCIPLKEYKVLCKLRKFWSFSSADLTKIPVKQTETNKQKTKPNQNQTKFFKLILFCAYDPRWHFCKTEAAGSKVACLCFAGIFSCQLFGRVPSLVSQQVRLCTQLASSHSHYGKLQKTEEGKALHRKTKQRKVTGLWVQAKKFKVSGMKTSGRSLCTSGFQNIS